MSKLSKLVNDPKAFLIDAAKKRLSFIQDVLDAQLTQVQPKKAAPLIKRESNRLQESKKNVFSNQSNLKLQSIDRMISEKKDVDEGVDILEMVLDAQSHSTIEVSDDKINFLLFDADSLMTETLRELFSEEIFYFKPWFPLNEKDKKIQNRKALEESCEKSTEAYISLMVKLLMPLLNHKSAIIFFEEDLLVEKLTIIAARKIGLPTILWRDVATTETVLCDFLIGRSPEKEENFLIVPENFMADLMVYNQNQKKISREMLFDLINFDQYRKTIYVSLSFGVKDSVRAYRDYVKKSLVSLNNFVLSNNDIQVIVNIDEVNRVFDRSMVLDDRIFLNGIKTAYEFDVFKCLSLSDYCFVDSMCVFSVANSYGCPSFFIQKDIKDDGGLDFNKIWVELTLLKKDRLDEKNIYSKDFFVDQMSFFLQSTVVKDYKTLEEKGRDVLEKPKKNLIFASEFGEKALLSTHKYLVDLLGVDGIKQSNPKLNNMLDLIDVDCFIQWGIKETETKRWQRRVAKIYGKPVLVVEDGFLRSVDIGLSGEPGLSILLDDKTAYYNAKEPSRLEYLIQESHVSDEQRLRARQVIDSMVENRISKYNHAPNLKLKVGREGHPKILLIDQRYGDQSVEYGLASTESFDRMLQDAISKYKNHDILVKQHPDAIKGGKSSYFSDDKLRFAAYTDNVFPINFDVNPYALFDLVDEVFVGTSGMGFEALLAGKKVHCYGAPFYAGWGLTQDHIVVDRRKAVKSLEEVFFISYIHMSRYYSPIRGSTCTIEELILDLVKMRGW